MLDEYRMTSDDDGARIVINRRDGTGLGHIYTSAIRDMTTCVLCTDVHSWTIMQETSKPLDRVPDATTVRGDRTLPAAAVVTGAAGGIGLAIAQRLVADGWAVLLQDRDPAIAESAAALNAPPTRVAAVDGDVADPVHVTDVIGFAVERFGRLDLVVANAGVGGPFAPLLDLSLEDFDMIVAVNLRGVFLTLQAGGRALRAQGGGSLVAVGSIFGAAPPAALSAYSASKAGVEAMVRSMAQDVGRDGIRVNCIAPGYIATPMQESGLRMRATLNRTSVDQQRRLVHDIVPLGRFGTGQDVANAVAYLVSDDAAYVTGHTLTVGGGIAPW